MKISKQLFELDFDIEDLAQPERKTKKTEKERKRLRNKKIALIGIPAVLSAGFAHALRKGYQE